MKELIDPGQSAVYKYTCDNCFNEIDNEECYPIEISFPYGHPLDSFLEKTFICSDMCAIEFFRTSIEKFGAFKIGLLDSIDKELENMV